MDTTTVTCTWWETSVIRTSSVPPRAWVGPTIPTYHNQTQLRSQRLQHHDGSLPYNPTTPDDGHSNRPQAWKRHAHTRPARQPLMFVNSQKSGHLGEGLRMNLQRNATLLSKTLRPERQNSRKISEGVIDQDIRQNFFMIASLWVQLRKQQIFLKVILLSIKCVHPKQTPPLQFHPGSMGLIDDELCVTCRLS